jgi:hypothetical protein
VTIAPIFWPGAQLEDRDRLLGAGDDRALARDRAQLVDGAVEQLRVRDRLAEAHVDGDARSAWAPASGSRAELLHQLAADLGVVQRAEAGRLVALDALHGHFLRGGRRLALARPFCPWPWPRRAPPSWRRSSASCSGVSSGRPALPGAFFLFFVVSHFRILYEVSNTVPHFTQTRRFF